MKHYAIIGKPVMHSLAGEWFSDYFRKTAIDADFRMIEPESDDMKSFRKWILKNQLDGLLVTIPFKKEVMQYLNVTDKHASAIGAANIIAVRNEQLYGFNEDHAAFEAELKQLRPGGFHNAVVLGIGGAAAAIVYALERMNIHVLKVSRREEASDKVYNELIEQDLQNADLIINATPLGMAPLLIKCPPIDYQWLNPNALAFDLIYNPAETLFLKKCVEAGCQTANGKGMVIKNYQSALELWGLV